MVPDWVLAHKKPGTTVKKIGNNYYLYYATSSRVQGKKYPVSKQTYIGKITPDGVISDRVAINIGKTQASILGELIPELPGELQNVIVLKVREQWICTKTSAEKLRKLEEMEICKDGTIIYHDI